MLYLQGFRYFFKIGIYIERSAARPNPVQTFINIPYNKTKEFEKCIRISNSGPRSL